MFGLKGKTLLFFIITTLLLLSVGVYFFMSINTLKKKVESRFEPKQQTELLKSLTLDINNLNNQYLNDTLELSDRYIDSIIENVEESIYQIQTESKKIRFENSDSLDIIPTMLYELKRKNFELIDLRNSGEDDFIFSLEKVIQSEFKNKLLSEKDSIIVTHQITSYIKENKFFEEQPEEDLVNYDERNFFQRLFNSKVKNNNVEVQEAETAEVRKPIIEIDTTVQQKVDTINQLNVLSSGIDLIVLFDKIQSRRIRYINNVQSVEKDIYELNYGINKKIEGIINDFILQQYASYESYLNELNSETDNQTTILLFAIFGFTLFAIVLIFRFFKDINSSVKYQNTLKLKEEHAVREAEEKQRFLNTMSHEVRTPLTSIIGYIDLLEGDDNNVQAIRSSANYLFQMTNEILDIAKINLGVIEIRKENIDLTKMLREVVNNFIPSIESRGLAFNFELPKEPIYVYTDGQRVQQILYNLIHNAIKFTNEGTIELKVDVLSNEGAYNVIFRVIDSGVGMSKKDQVKVFEDFHQAGTHKSKMKGTGLGLGIVDKLVHLLSGNLQLNSEKGKGTTFVISFNFEKVKKGGIVHEGAEDDSIEKYLNRFRDQTIMIIDDDVLITSLYQKILNGTGAKLIVFNNPKIALESLLDEPFDLLIIDYKMPEMSGYEFLIHLKSKMVNIPKTIISTANAMLDDQEKEELNSFDKVIFKPLRKQYFLNQIDDILGMDIASFTLPPSPKLQETKVTFQALRNYIGEEPSELIEILEVIVEENEKSLKDLKKAIVDSDRAVIAFVIHQLSSRFSQVDESLTVQTNLIESELRGESSELSLDSIHKLYRVWMQSQGLIKDNLKQLKLENSNV